MVLRCISGAGGRRSRVSAGSNGYCRPPSDVATALKQPIEGRQTYEIMLLLGKSVPETRNLTSFPSTKIASAPLVMKSRS